METDISSMRILYCPKDNCQDGSPLQGGNHRSLIISLEGIPATPRKRELASLPNTESEYVFLGNSLVESLKGKTPSHFTFLSHLYLKDLNQLINQQGARSSLIGLMQKKLNKNNLIDKHPIYTEEMIFLDTSDKFLKMKKGMIPINFEEFERFSSSFTIIKNKIKRNIGYVHPNTTKKFEEIKKFLSTY